MEVTVPTEMKMPGLFPITPHEVPPVEIISIGTQDLFGFLVLVIWNKILNVCILNFIKFF